MATEVVETVNQLEFIVLCKDELNKYSPKIVERPQGPHLLKVKGPGQKLGAQGPLAPYYFKHW